MQTHILFYTDDDEEDRVFFSEGVAQMRRPVDLRIFENGISLLQALETIEAQADLPGTIVCDMKMHLIDGFEVLKMVKANPRLKHIPFIIFSTSSSKYDREMVMENGALAFFTKPNTITDLHHIIDQMIFLSIHNSQADN